MENTKQKDKEKRIKLISCNHNGTYQIELQKGNETYNGEDKKDIRFALKSALEKIAGFETKKINIRFQYKDDNAYVTLYKDWSKRCFEIINGKKMREFV